MALIIGTKKFVQSMTVQNCFSFDSKVLIWGGNHFAEQISHSSRTCDCLADDRQRNGDTDFADQRRVRRWTNFDGHASNVGDCFKFDGLGCQGDMANKEERVHPTQKPVALAKWVFGKFKISGFVLDLFGGSGSTLLACEQTRPRQIWLWSSVSHDIAMLLSNAGKN